jgi:hypothetical protein
MDLEVAAVDAVVVGDHHARQLDVLVLDALERAVKSAGHELEASERVLLQLRQLFVEIGAGLGHRAATQPKRPET